MSNLVDLDVLRKEFEKEASLEEAKKYIAAQDKMVSMFQKKIKELEEKNKHLEQMLLTSKPALAINSLAKFTSEEAICLQQIKILEGHSMSRELTMEEVKKLDLFIKNLKTIREAAAAEASAKDVTDELGEQELVRLAISDAEATDEG